MHINMIFLVLAYLGSHAAGVNFDTTTALIISIALYVVWYGIGFYNRCIRMGRVGHSWGRGVLGINLVSERSGRPIGVSKALVRENAHIADILILGFGFLLPIWDAKRQTLADKFMHTVTVEGPVPAVPPAARRRSPGRQAAQRPASHDEGSTFARSRVPGHDRGR